MGFVEVEASGRKVLHGSIPRALCRGKSRDPAFVCSNSVSIRAKITPRLDLGLIQVSPFRSRFPVTTPMMRQYRKAKGAHPDAILFFRMGDFFELFYEDAETASRLLGLTLTSRAKDSSGKIPMAGVPVRSLDQYLARLLRLGQKVAICDQIQDPSEAKGIVDRAVTRIVTPGTLTEESLLEAKDNNYLLAFLPLADRVGLSWVDLSTGVFSLCEVEPRLALDEVARIGPTECLIPEESRGGLNERVLTEASNAVVSACPGWIFDRDYAERLLTRHFEVSTLDGFGCADQPASVRAAGAILHYLTETQKVPLTHIRKMEMVRPGERMLLDAATQSCLEIVRSMRGRGREGTLLSVLDKTVTSMGGRLLKTWLLAPLLDVEKIRERQAAVSEMVENSFLRADVRKALLSVYDLERIATKVATGRANGRDLLSLRQSLEALPDLIALTRDAFSELLAQVSQIPALDELRERIRDAIVDDPPVGIKDGGLIREGFDGDLDEVRGLSTHGKEWIAEFQKREIERTGIPTLKVGFNKVFGYYLEITHANKDRIPADYQRKQTLKNAERYITPELKEHETKVLTADERAKAMEHSLFLKVRDEAAESVDKLQSIAVSVAKVDVIGALAEVAVKNRYVMPKITEGGEVLLLEGRHPVLEVATQTESFVPNDTRLGGEDGGRVMILTGPNMAGKSTYIRQVALLTLMAQCGSFVPAEEAHVGVVDRIFTRMGAADELFHGKSTFMVEMTETANILNNATEKSLVILDEIGRGTSTFDGLSIAWAVTEYICEQIGAKTLFATHYHELTDLADIFSEVRNYNVLVQEWGDEVVFLRRIGPGGTDKSYGIHVARLAGIPKMVIRRSRSLLRRFEDEHARLQARVNEDPQELDAQEGEEAELVFNAGSKPSVLSESQGEEEDRKVVRETPPASEGRKRRSRKPVAQLTLFPVTDDPVVSRLRDVNLDDLSPQKALYELEKLKEMIGEGRKAHPTSP